MKCPYCLGTRTRVLESRVAAESSLIRRRRACTKCSKRFTTYERIETPILSVMKKDGSREQFVRDKIISGMVKACEKRPIRREEIESAAINIEAELRQCDSNEIPSRLIGELVANTLKNMDDVAYVRFASVYRRFRDVNQFEKEVQKLKKR
ncbi:transcriptional repressor NrdR [Candidatus Woesearchaeota archaeon]|nr:transcriptional repressor NrdR [Candidatus Woesearchaeota archaeon]